MTVPSIDVVNFSSRTDREAQAAIRSTNRQIIEDSKCEALKANLQGITRAARYEAAAKRFLLIPPKGRGMGGEQSAEQ